jgi:hypothetical protein
MGAFRFSDRKLMAPFEYKYCIPAYGKLLLKRSDEQDLQILNPQTGKIGTLSGISISDPFYDGLAVVHAGEACEDRNNYGYVDSNFQLVIPQQFSEAWNFNDGLAAARDANKRWGFIDRSGNWVIPPRFEKVSRFRAQHALLLAKVPDGGWGFLDRSGAWVLPPNLEEAYLEFYYPVVVFASASRTDPASGMQEFYVLNSHTGQVIFQQKTPHPVKFNMWSNGLGVLENYPLPGNYSLLDPEGKLLLEACEYLSLQQDSLLYAVRAGQFYSYKYQEQALVPEKLQLQPVFESWELQRVPLYGPAIFTDRKGRLQIPFQKDGNYNAYAEPPGIIGRHDRENGPTDFTFYDKTGKLRFQLTSDIELVELIDENLVRTMRGEKTGLISLIIQKEIIPAEFDDSELLPKQGLIRVFTEGEVSGYFDFLGRRYFSD